MKGFSLIEMLVVIAILAAVAIISLPLAKPSDTVRLQAAARDLVGALRLTRSAAIARSTDLVLVIDADKRIFESAVVSPKSFAADIVAQMKIALLETVGHVVKRVAEHRELGCAADGWRAHFEVAGG